MAISLHGVDSILNAYHKQQRLRNEGGKFPETTGGNRGKAVIDQVTLSKQWLGEADAPDKISERLIEDLLKNEKK